MLATMVVSMCFLVSCGGDDDSPLDNHRFVDLTFDSSQSFQEIDFNGANLSTIIGETSETWCQAYVLDDKLRVTVMENRTYDERIATVTFTDTNTDTKAVFHVTQKQNNAIIFDTNTYVVDASGNCLIDVGFAGGSFNVRFRTNVDYQLVMPDVAWIASGTRGLREASTEFTVLPNTDGDEREAYIQMRDQASEFKGYIVVRQGAEPYLRFDNGSELLQVDEHGGTFEIGITANFDFIAETVRTVNWVNIGTLSSLGNYKYKQPITVEALPDGTNERSCEISFHRPSGVTSNHRTLTIVQKRSEQ